VITNKITTAKNKAVPMYAKKFSSGLGKKNKVKIPIMAIIGVKYFTLI